MDTPIDVCTVLYEVTVDHNTMLIDSLEDEVDILYGQESSNEQIQSE